MAKGSQAGGSDLLPLMYTLLVFAAALFVPVLLSRFSSSSGRSDSDSSDSGGGEGGLPRPPAPPKTPPGGLPLDDARPARVRLRDARRLDQRLPRRQRRPAREPARSPSRPPTKLG